MKRLFLLTAISILCATSAAAGLVVYDNTTTDTFQTLLYSAGPYTGIGDQIQSTLAEKAVAARIQFFNAGDPGSFDATLSFYEVGSPVGALIASFTQTGIISAGGDVFDVVFDLGHLFLPQDLVFVVSVNAPGGMDLGLNLFEPPTTGSSDNTFLIVDSGGFSQAPTTDENVYLQLQAVPEPSSWSLVGLGLLAAGFRATLRRRSRPRD